jgi:ubiquitin-protein ligase
MKVDFVQGVVVYVSGGEWLLEIIVPDRYPYVPPEMKFRTPICHPNVHFKVVRSEIDGS